VLACIVRPSSASVVGKAFTVAAVAAGSQASVEDVEVVCEAWRPQTGLQALAEALTLLTTTEMR
jgi:hypothetical protein